MCVKMLLTYIKVVLFRGLCHNIANVYIHWRAEIYYIRLSISRNRNRTFFLHEQCLYVILQKRNNVALHFNCYILM